MIEILTPDLTPFDGVEIPNLEAGQDSTPIPFVLRNTGPAVFDVLVVLQAQDPVTGHWRSTNLPPLDELWPRLRVTGHDWNPVGTGRALHLATLPAESLTPGEIRFHPPATAATLTWHFRLAVVAAENSYPIPAGARQGILTGLGDHGHSALLRGFQVTPSIPISDHIQVSAGQLIHRGRLVGRVATDIVLDQLDSASEPLAPGESYLALLTAGPTGITITKSQRAPIPARPPAPPWEPVLAVLEVLAVLSEGTTTEIAATHITDLRVLDRYHAEPGVGLQLRLHAGRAIAGGTLRYHSALTPLLLPPIATTSLWQRANGAWDLAPATEPAPETTALGPLWIATTDADSVTDLQDRRTFAAETIVLHLRGDFPATPSQIAETLIAHDGLVLERVLYRLSGNGGGTAGQTQLDLHLGGITLFPSFAQDDHRPAWPFDANDLVRQSHIHEPTELSPGQLLQLISIEHPTGGPPAWAEAYLLCRRP